MVFHPEDGPCPKIWCIPFLSNIIYFFGSEVNLCSEETVVGEFEVRYPVMCEWLRWSLRVLRKVYLVKLPCHRRKVEC